MQPASPIIIIIIILEFRVLGFRACGALKPLLIHHESWDHYQLAERNASLCQFGKFDRIYCAIAGWVRALSKDCSRARANELILVLMPSML